MKRNLTLSALALILTAGVAGAAEVTPGVAQIAAQLGVNAADYTAPELGAMIAAKENGQQGTYAYFLNHVNREPEATVNAGKAQFAAQLGVDPADYTGAELQMISDAKRAGDTQALDYVLSHTNRKTYDIAPQPAMGRDA